MERIIKSVVLLVLLTAVVGCEKENIPPTCDIINPNDNDTIQIGDTVAIQVEANDQDGNIIVVKLYIDEVGVSSTSIFPYNLEWDTKNVILGKHLIKVVAEDNDGSDTYDEINLNIIGLPTDANAGEDQTFTDETVSTTLAANAPETEYETGKWSIVSGDGGNFDDETNPTAVFTGQECTSYQLQWTITTTFNSSSDNVNITFNQIPTVADAGADQTFTDGTISTTLAANTPEAGHGTGQWSIVSGDGGSFDNPSDPNTIFSGTINETYYLQWTISTNCQVSEDDVTVFFGEPIVIVANNITADATWTSDKVYVLGGRITVVDGVTLTIESGTIIKGQAGTGANATALLIARGGKLMAEGTASAPIIFTTVADEIEPSDIAAGNFGSPNLDPDTDGLWGGVLILGKAYISASNDDGQVSEVQIEGIPTSDPNGLYGGNDDADNSGVIKYISIRHGGSEIGSRNEINGLTLGGVGHGTVIENVEVIANQDDGIEWFGGSVNVKNAVVWNCNDDAIDCDQDWTGTLDNFVVISPGDHNFELDGPEGTRDEGGYTIKNGWVIANDPDPDRFSSDLINTDDNTSVAFENIFITGIEEGQVINRVAHVIGTTTFSNIVLDVPAAKLADYVKDGNVPTGVTAQDAPKVPGDIDLSVFGWTWAKQAGKF